MQEDTLPKRGRPRSCTCGTCHKCKRADYMRKWWARKTPDEKRAHIAKRAPDSVRRNRRETARKARAEGRVDVEKVAARHAVNNAVARGLLTRGTCAMTDETCRGRIEAHHSDYSRPLDVVWLCSWHHRRLHGQVAT